MSEPWSHKWERVDADDFQGGQGLSFRVRARDGSGTVAFVKTLKMPRDPQARGRFRREVIAYETLPHADIPRLLEHNASEWENVDIPLFMALEYIEGVTLFDRITTGGRADVDAALATTVALGQTLAICHAANVAHRDVKPKNIMLRGGDLMRPVLVDFGLSFNADDADDDDLTRTGEEIGNGFLRLPEHRHGARTPVGDVAQLAGVLIYAMTGVVPGVLLDEARRMPHQRETAREILRAQLTETQFRRLAAVFDRAFQYVLTDRYPTAPDLIADLGRVNDPEIEGDDLMSLQARLTEFAQEHGLAAQQDLRAKLTALLTATGTHVRALAETYHLRTTQTGQSIDASRQPPRGQTLLALTTDDNDPPIWVTYLFQLVGSEFVFTADGVEYWRAEWIDEHFATSIQRAAAATILSQKPLPPGA